METMADVRTDPVQVVRPDTPERRCHCGAPTRNDGSDYDGWVCAQWPICEGR